MLQYSANRAGYKTRRFFQIIGDLGFPTKNTKASRQTSTVRRLALVFFVIFVPLWETLTPFYQRGQRIPEIIIAHHICFYFTDRQRTFDPHRNMVGIIRYPDGHFFPSLKKASL